MEMSRYKKRIIAALVIFAVFAVLYFIPAVTIPHKIFIPLLTLGLFSIGLAPWEITVALLLSAVGDFSGSFKAGGSPDVQFYAFVGQMTFFALAHIFYITYFIRRALKLRKERKEARKFDGLYLGMVLLLCVILFYTALTRIIPCVEDSVLKICVICYAVIILVMLFCALMQKDWISGLGAALFVFSDLVLAWNMFVNPIPGEKFLIMVPYYAAQLIIASRAVVVKFKEI